MGTMKRTYAGVRRYLRQKRKTRNTLDHLDGIPFREKTARAQALRAIETGRSELLPKIFGGDSLRTNHLITLLSTAILYEDATAFAEIWSMAMRAEDRDTHEGFTHDLSRVAEYALYHGDTAALNLMLSWKPEIVMNLTFKYLEVTHENGLIFIANVIKPSAERVMKAVHGQRINGDQLRLLERHLPQFDLRTWWIASKEAGVSAIDYMLRFHPQVFVQHIPGEKGMQAWQHNKDYQERWLKVARSYPEFYEIDPAWFRPQANNAILRHLQKEQRDETDSSRHYAAFRLAAFFGTEQRVLEYMERWAKPNWIQPLYDVARWLHLPEEKKPGNIKIWSDAVMQNGLKMAKLVEYADRIDPQRSADGKKWSLAATMRAAAPFAYKRGAENPQLAEACFENDLKERSFNLALNLLKKAPAQKNLPQITIDGARFGMEGAAFAPLPANDWRGPVLGKLTDCCQSVGTRGLHGTFIGHRAALHGTFSQNGGFYVVEKNDEILGATWAWQNEKGELCFDSLETLGKRVSAEQWQQIVTSYAEELTGHKNVTRFTVGLDGNHPIKSLSNAFNKALTPAKPPQDFQRGRGYISQDSKEQVEVWARDVTRPRKRERALVCR